MPGLTNRGALRITQKALANNTNGWFNNAGSPTTISSWYCALILSSSAAPTADTVVLSSLTQPAAANGYTDGGVTVAISTVGWPTNAQDDTNDKSVHTMQDVTWTSTPGAIGTIRHLVLTDDNATVANRQVLLVWQLASDVVIGAGTTVIFEQAKLEIRNTNW